MLRNSMNLFLRSLCVGQLGVTRSFSAPATKLVNLELNEKSGIATLSLNRPPVNSMNLELLTDIATALDEVEANRSKGLILTSSANTVFSAGLDITEMYKPNQDRLRKYWSSVQDVWLKLYGSSFPTAAAIHGHAPAGGCLLSLSCEYRVMCSGFTIGLNETRLGIVAPEFFQATIRNVVSRRHAEKALTLGTMFTTEEALNIGLVDEVAVDKSEAIAKCEQFLVEFKKVSPQARALTKQMLRKHELSALEDSREQDIDLFVFAVNQPKVQKGLEVYMQNLKKK